MATRMLIDAAHPEETRVVVVRGTRLEEFDFESATKQQLKGNIYLAKVTRVEPSLQAAFVDYGGNRHGFLPFNEIHPDYYQIPIADRQALLEQEAWEGAAEVAEDEAAAGRSADSNGDSDNADANSEVTEIEISDGATEIQGEAEDGDDSETVAAADSGETATDADSGIEVSQDAENDDGASDADVEAQTADDDSADAAGEKVRKSVEALGGDELDEVIQPRRRAQRRYKIQEVIKRRQIILVQVVKEERGNKGAALTTYLSLAGRYCVLMPNTARGGGVSRKITSQSDRKKLKSIIDGLSVPEGMGLIVRTAGQARSKAEIKRDYEYLLRLWDSVRALTLESTAPALTYEEANLIKRSIRDLYTKEIDEVLVEGEEGYKAAKNFMKMLMPSHAKRVQPYIDRIPLFHRYKVEQQFDSMHSPTVQLKSGGYIVISPTEALVAIDVNSGRSTKERNIEETAYRTNLEAAEEVARQLRLRDLAGLVVIDFIDMDESRNARNVERRIKDKLKSDRARIQVGRISPFGLLEMSRQRLRPSLQEASTEVCNHCEGTGVVRSIESSALHLLRAIEEEGIRGRAAEINVHAATAVAIYLLNQKRSSVLTLEERFNMDISVAADESLVPPDFRMERLHSRSDDEMEAIASDVVSMVAYDDPEDDVEEEVTETRDEESDEGAAKKRRRRGKRGGRRRRGANEEETSTEENSNGDAAEAKPSESKASEEASSTENTPENTEEGEKEDKPRRRRRRPRRRRGAANNNAEPGAEATAEASTETAEGSTAVATENAEPVVAEVASEKAPEVETAEPVAAEPVAVEPFVEETVAPIAAVETTPVEVSEPEPAAAVVEPVNTDPVTVSAGGAEEKEEAKPRKRGWWRRD
ncbi:MAG: Rne/Rng family ribonuclease [Alphaproteobacteria bacterium]|nr:Rne/Rng family ribonuclease [Alphaproteobacteria bacterium]MBT4019265.1 Rne/Rng family ribonuclease [Alphaproteobacteria bacterium]MBT5159929.1 Rne/Rng family ribonuclease [Alphaproteobacteria bacterium]MBT6386678.1 Rne/Rng family ribonuclease [Alphaproteobacteria bacterium]